VDAVFVIRVAAVRHGRVIHVLYTSIIVILVRTLKLPTTITSYIFNTTMPVIIYELYN